MTREARKSRESDLARRRPASAKSSVPWVDERAGHGLFYLFLHHGSRLSREGEGCLKAVYTIVSQDYIGHGLAPDHHSTPPSLACRRLKRVKLDGEEGTQQFLDPTAALPLE